MGQIKYNVVGAKNPQTGSLIYIAQVARAPRITLADLIDSIAQNSQLPRAVLPTALNAILKSINNFVLNGHSVSIPRLGTFSVTMHSHGAETEEAFDISTNYRGLTVRFLPSTELKEQLQYNTSLTNITQLEGTE